VILSNKEKENISLAVIQMCIAALDIPRAGASHTF